MHIGYLLIETDENHPGLLRLRTTDRSPTGSTTPEAESGWLVQYSARFNDIDAAQMHAHTLLRHSAVDIEAGLYRSAPADAVAAIDSIGLRHRREALAPSLSELPGLASAVSRNRKWRQRRERTWQIVGIAAVLYLLAKLLFGL